ncbi:MAG: hypothetical protein V9G19_25740 [Tetrasphaera sp.]
MAKNARASLVVKDLTSGAVRRLEPTPQQSPPGATRPFEGGAWDWSADGKWLLVSGGWPGPGYDPSFWRVEWPSGRFHKLPIHGDVIDVNEISADGSVVTGSESTGSAGQVPFVLDVATGKRRFIPKPPGVDPTIGIGNDQVYLSGDGRHVVTSWKINDEDIDRVVQLSRVSDLKVEQILTQRNTGLTALAGAVGVNYDGSVLLLGCMRRPPAPYFIPADLYRYNRLTRGQTRITVTSKGVPLNSSIDRIRGSADQRTVLIGTYANNLVKGDAPVGEWLPIRANDVFTVEIDPLQH